MSSTIGLTKGVQDLKTIAVEPVHMNTTEAVVTSTTLTGPDYDTIKDVPKTDNVPEKINSQMKSFDQDNRVYFTLTEPPQREYPENISNATNLFSLHDATVTVGVRVQSVDQAGNYEVQEMSNVSQ